MHIIIIDMIHLILLPIIIIDLIHPISYTSLRKKLTMLFFEILTSFLIDKPIKSACVF